MESSPRDEYLDLHAERLHAMLDLAGDLPLFYEPTVTLMAETGQLPAVSIWGRELDSYDARTDSGVEAIYRAHEARLRLSEFGSLTTMLLLRAMVEAEPAAYAGLSESEVQAVLDQHTRQAAQLVSDTKRTFAATDFNNGSLCIETMGLHGPERPLARGLVIVTGDGLAVRTVSLGRVEPGYGGVERSLLWLNQSVQPAQDDALRAVADFFLRRHGDEAGHAQVTAVFTARLRGAEAVDLSDLYARYSLAEQQQIEGFVTALQARADRVRRDLPLNVDNPELFLPSVPELEEYEATLRRLLENR